MKKHIITSIMMLAVSFQIFAQQHKSMKNSDVDGIYLTITDFKNGKVTYPTDNQHRGDRIKLKQFFISPEIISIEQDKTTVYYKDSIFAIRLKNGENYRFINRTPCLIADTSSLYIYINKTTKTEYKQSGPHRIAIKVPITYYYFSLSNQDSVYSLSLPNLRKYALSNANVHTLVCNKFISDDMLYEINPQTGRFLINETLLSIF